MLIYFIIGCEIGFWLLLLGGLWARYVLKRVVLSRFLLLCVPAVDVALLLATAADLSNGRPAEFAHGLAAAYLGFTVVYGHSIINWMDQYVAYRLSLGERPLRKNLYGWRNTVHEWKEWFRGVLACAVAASLIMTAIQLAGSAQDTEALSAWFDYMGWFLGIWLLGWPLWYTVFPKRRAADCEAN